MPSLSTVFTLMARATEADNDNNSKYADISCPKPLPNLIGTGAPLFGPGTINLHQLMVYISAPCLLITTLSCFFLSWRHLHRYTSPAEQRKILRIVNLPLAYCMFNFLALIFTLDHMYIEPIGAVCEAFAVAALFFLVLEGVCPDGVDREAFFRETEMREKDGSVRPGGSLGWYKTIYATVLQYPLLKTILIVIQIITQYTGDFCESSFKPTHAHLWLIMHWSFSSTAYREGARQNRYHTAPAQRRGTLLAIRDALDVSDIVAGTVVAMAALLRKLVSRVAGTTDERTTPDLARLSRSAPGHGGGRSMRDGRVSPSPNGDGCETSYTAGYHAPPVPRSAMARDPSPAGMGGGMRSSRAEEGRFEQSGEGLYGEERGLLRGGTEMV